MKLEHRRRIVFRFLLSIWAMITLILVFTLVLLVNEMAQQGNNPLGALLVEAGSAGPSARRPQEQPDSGAQREALLYFVSDDGAHLETERYKFEAGSTTVEHCRQVLESLISGPSTGLAPVLPQTAEVKSLYLLPEGELVIDFSGGFLGSGIRQSSATQEMLTAQALAHTLSQAALKVEGDPPVRKIRILVEGAIPVERFPAHLDLREPWSADAGWVRPIVAESGGNG